MALSFLNDQFVSKAKSALELIKDSQKITLLTHMKSDPDGMSACTALKIILVNLNKSVEIVYPDIPTYTFSSQAKEYLVNQHKQHPDLIICLDTSDFSMLYHPSEFDDVKSINIDHHVSNSIKGTLNFVNHTASSACEELAAIIFAWGKEFITKDVAHSLLVGILYDSQSFGTQSTTIRTLQISTELATMWNLSIPELKHELATLQPPQILAFWGKLFNNIKTTPSGSCAWISVTKNMLDESGMKYEAINGFSNAFAALCNTDITIFFYETSNNRAKASFRSKHFDVNSYAAKFKGGGHTNAAGVSKKMPLSDLIEEIIKGL